MKNVNSMLVELFDHKPGCKPVRDPDCQNPISFESFLKANKWHFTPPRLEPSFTNSR